LRRRLSEEAELVPCPQCYWVNEDLVEGYRRSRYQRLGSFAFGVGFFGTVISLICGWFTSLGPPADRRALPYCLYVGPALFVSLAAGMLLLQYWLRGRIRPNRSFPLAPELPPGSPPALVRGGSTGELTPARVDNWEDPARNDWLYFRVGQQSLPRRCCECLGITSKDRPQESSTDDAIQLDIPHCEDCARKTQRAFQRICWSLILFGSLAGSAAALFVNPGPYWFWVIIVSSSFFSICLATYVASAMTAPAKVAIVDRSRCLVRIRFRNAEYGRIVAEQNAGSGKAV
jgi:hypothetical protein